jgi:hypothetical protein
VLTALVVISKLQRFTMIIVHIQVQSTISYNLYFVYVFFRRMVRAKSFSKFILKLGMEMQLQKTLPTHSVLWKSHLMFQRAQSVPQKSQLILKLMEDQLSMSQRSTMSWRELFQPCQPLQILNLCLFLTSQKEAQFQTKIMLQVRK